MVNSGTSTYAESTERLRQRGTCSHNTVEINGNNSSEVWKSFRVAQRANPRDFSIKNIQGQWKEIACSHDGYTRLSGRNIHRRSWQLEVQRLIVKDEITGVFKSAIARFYLHPDLTVERDCVVLPSGRKIRVNCEGGDIRWVQSTWHPEFGKSVPNQCLEIEMKRSVCKAVFEW